MFIRIILCCGFLGATVATASAQRVLVPQVRSTTAPQAVSPAPQPTTAPVHFDEICVRVTSIAGTALGSFSFECLLQDGQKATYHVANYADTTGKYFDIGQSSSDIVLLQNVAQENRISQQFAIANTNISQVVTTFLLYKQANPDSNKNMLVRGVYSIDPNNSGKRAVQVVSFNPG